MREVLGLGDLITSFASAIPHAQQQLDKEWAESRDQYLQALPPLVAEWLPLATMLAPGRQVLTSSEMTAEFLFRREESEAARLSVSLANIGFGRKFASSTFFRHKLTAKVVAHSPEKEKPRG